MDAGIGSLRSGFRRGRTATHSTTTLQAPNPSSRDGEPTHSCSTEWNRAARRIAGSALPVSSQPFSQLFLISAEGGRWIQLRQLSPPPPSPSSASRRRSCTSKERRSDSRPHTASGTRRSGFPSGPTRIRSTSSPAEPTSARTDGPNARTRPPPLLSEKLRRSLLSGLLMIADELLFAPVTHRLILFVSAVCRIYMVIREYSF